MHYRHAQDFSALLTRDTRRGYLDIRALMGSYDASRCFGFERRIDLDEVAHAMALVPAHLFKAHSWQVVQTIEGFGGDLLQGGKLRALLVDDDRVIVETSHFGALVQLATSVCIVQEAMESSEALTPKGIDEIVHEHNESGAEESLPSFVIDDLAFVWGCDPNHLRKAQRATLGALIPTLLEAKMPVVELHNSLGPKAVTRRAVDRGHRVVRTLAEAGYLRRPICLFIGPDALTDCVSPYPREIRDLVLRWGKLACGPIGDSVIGDDIATAIAIGVLEQIGEDTLYALVHDFVSSDPKLMIERHRAEKTVGIVRHCCGDVTFETIDLGRIESQCVDTRLFRFASAFKTEPTPLVLRLGVDLIDRDAALLETILATLGQNIHSVTLAFEGKVSSLEPLGEEAAVIAPTLLIPWDAPMMQAPGVSFDLEHWVLDGIQRRAIYDMPCADPIIVKGHEALGKSFGATGGVVGAMPWINGLQEALFSGVLPMTTPVSCVVVQSEQLPQGRWHVATRRAFSAVAIACLGQINTPKVHPEEPKPEPLPRDLARRTVRLKA